MGHRVGIRKYLGLYILKSLSSAPVGQHAISGSAYEFFVATESLQYLFGLFGSGELPDDFKKFLFYVIFSLYDRSETMPDPPPIPVYYLQSGVSGAKMFTFGNTRL